MRRPLTPYYLLAGFLLGGGALGVIDLSATSTLVKDVATIALIVILFRDGLEVDGEFLRASWRVPARKLVVGMAVTCGIVSVVTKSLTDLSWTEAFLVGALLSPTDPVLSSGVVTNPRVPHLVRHS